MSLQYLIEILKGGIGSGNFDHSGRPGHIGGSASKGGFMIKNGPNVISMDIPEHLGELISQSGMTDIDVTIQTKQPSSAAKNYRRGYYNDDGRKIVVFDWATDPKTGKQTKLTDDQRAYILAHELGHADHYARGIAIPHKPDRERYAENFANELITKVMPDKLSSLLKWRGQTYDPASGHYLD